VQVPFSDLAERYNSSDEILRQIVRHELVGRALAEHLPPPPSRIADVGGGAGQQAIPLSRRGYEVIIIDSGDRPCRGCTFRPRATKMCTHRIGEWR
jgi:ubiquinone/menaquinone biosynthesis C-methylase UbiE